jgi:hypothetical protein
MGAESEKELHEERRSRRTVTELTVTRRRPGGGGGSMQKGCGWGGEKAGGLERGRWE